MLTVQLKRLHLWFMV